MPDTPKPRGRALEWTDADVEAMTSSEALMAAQDEVAQAWRQDAPADARGFIDAAEADGTPGPDAPA